MEVANNKNEAIKGVTTSTTDGDRTRNPHLRKVMRYHCATMACDYTAISIT